jgi:hypothetical protein
VIAQAAKESAGHVEAQKKGNSIASPSASHNEKAVVNQDLQRLSVLLAEWTSLLSESAIIHETTCSLIKS